MATSTEAEARLCEVMLAAYGAGDDFEFELGRLCAGYRVAHDKRMRDRQAAELLPLGADVVAARQGCHRVTAYRRAARAKLVALISPLATTT